jgi:uncharacterized protein (DUF433 family)
MPQTLTARIIPSHILFDEAGRPWIEGTGRKVIEITYEKRAGLSAEQIQEAHPDLSLAKIHAALAYYYDHQQEMDAEMERLDRWVEEMRAKNPNQLTREMLEERLRARQGHE